MTFLGSISELVSGELTSNWGITGQVELTKLVVDSGQDGFAEGKPRCWPPLPCSGRHGQ